MITPVGSPVAYWQITRIEKLHHYQTILYEIDMLRFAHGGISPKWQGEREGDVWVYLESFLVHYRNLLDFFGKPPRDTDLSIRCPEVIWEAALGLDSRCPNSEDLKRMETDGHRLWMRYEDGRGREDTISRYLHHCTTFRIEHKDWSPYEMMEDIRAILELFERHLPEFKPATNSDLLSGGGVVTVDGNRGHVTSTAATVTTSSNVEATSYPQVSGKEGT